MSRYLMKHINFEKMMLACLGRNTDDMNIGINHLSGDFCRRLNQLRTQRKNMAYLKKGTNVHVKAHICKPGRYHFCTTIMSILTHLCDQNTRTAAFILCKILVHLTSRKNPQQGTSFDSMYIKMI
jgi:hypothetical protein